ncbi:hypothetical protein N1851_000069 [Merluccius polli]|uniref:Uncharacterized protein n=1 Tax=Merluccius polli TaxID=89951 RepID=A0AA47PA06_MERPO|nr:hypothetical protein N1851_000069 [Merluccius polli]
MFVVFPSFLPTQTVKEGFYQLAVACWTREIGDPSTRVGDRSQSWARGDAVACWTREIGDPSTRVGDRSQSWARGDASLSRYTANQRMSAENWMQKQAECQPATGRQGTENRQAMLVVGDRRLVDLPGQRREAKVGGKSGRYQPTPSHGPFTPHILTTKQRVNKHHRR